jgi:hypothetical protein
MMAHKDVLPAYIHPTTVKAPIPGPPITRPDLGKTTGQNESNNSLMTTNPIISISTAPSLSVAVTKAEPAWT